MSTPTQNKKTRSFGIRLTEEMLRKIDQQRGDFPRACWIRYLLKKVLDKQDEEVKAVVD